MSPREELEIRITALLMGQLPPEEAVEVEARIAADPELAALHSRLRRAAELLREARTLPESEGPAVPLQLSKERRERLLATFREIKALPKPPKPLLPRTIQPHVSLPTRPQKKWGRPFVLAASIAVLVGVIYSISTPYYARIKSRPANANNSQEFAGDASEFAPVGRAPEPASEKHSLLHVIPDTSADPNGWMDRSGGAGDRRTVVAGTEFKNHWAAKTPATGGMSDSKSAPKDALPGSMSGRMGGGGGGAPTRPAPVYLPPTVLADESAPAAPTKPLLAMGRDSRDFETEKLLADGSAISSGLKAGEKPAGATGPVSGPEGMKGIKQGGGAGQSDDFITAIPGNSSTTWAFDSRAKRELASRSTRGDETKAATGEGRRYGFAQEGQLELSFRQQDKELFSDPKNIAAQQGREGEAKREPVSTLESEFRATDGGIPQLATDAEAKAQVGRYEAAIRGYDDILNKDPNNVAARAAREDLSRKKNEVASAGYSAARAQAMWETTSLWERPYQRFDRRPVVGSGQETPQLIDPAGNVNTASENTYWDNFGVNLDGAARPSKREPKADGKPAGDKSSGALGVEGLAINEREFFSGGGLGVPAEVAPLGEGAPDSSDRPAAKEDKVMDIDALTSFSLDLSEPRSTSGTVQFKETPPVLATTPAPPRMPIPGGAPSQPEDRAKGVSEITAGTGINPAQERFVNAFLAARKAEEFAAAGDTQKALETNRSAADTLAKLKEQWPKWQPELVEYRLKRTAEAISKAESKLAEAPAKPESAAPAAAPVPATSEPATPVKVPEPPPVPQPEVSTKDNAFSTFSLNVSDVSYQLAGASLDKGRMPEPATVRSEEFINAFSYRDPEPTGAAPLAFASERARYPFAHNRDLLRVSLKTAAAGREKGRPLNLVLLLDNSGSMERADRVEILKESLRVLTKQLQPQDKLSIITFSRTPRLWADGVTGEKAAEFAQRVGEITPQGGTDLSAALNLGYETALKHFKVGSINRVVLLTDGAANLGEVKPETLKAKVEQHRKEGVAFDCFGVGWEGYNDDLLEQLSRNGDGRYGFINTPEAAATEFAGQLAGALRVAASDVKVQIEFNPRRVTAYRQVGYAKHQLKKEQFRDNTVDAAEIGAAESGNSLYVLEVNAAGAGDIGIARARFKVPGTADYREHEWTIPYQAPAPAMEQASSSIRLAATAGAFAEWLAQSPFAAEITTDRLLGMINGVPAIYGRDARPAKLEAMIRQAKSISGR